MDLPKIVIPEKGFIKEYIDWAEKCTDAPKIFHLFCAMIIVGSCFGRSVFLPFGPNNLYPNLYVCLLAPTSYYRKSTCIELSRQILKRFESVHIMPDEFSPEIFIERLSGKPNSLLIWSEFGSALGYFDRSYMMGMKEILTKLYDCPDKYNRELKSKEYTIEKPIISILTASTPDWFIGHMKQPDLMSGFIPRFILVPHHTKHLHYSKTPKMKTDDINRLVKILFNLKEKFFSLSRNSKSLQDSNLLSLDNFSLPLEFPDSSGIYSDWYDKTEAEAETHPEPGIISSFYARLPDHVLKFAINFHLCEGEGIEISDNTFNMAKTLGNHLKNSYKKSVQQDLAFTKFERDRNKILKIIRSKGEVSHSDLLPLAHTDTNSFKLIIQTLAEQKAIFIESRGSGKYRTTWYINNPDFP